MTPGKGCFQPHTRWLPRNLSGFNCMDTHQISADRIHSLGNGWSAALAPGWVIEKKVETYANGGPPPVEDEHCADEIVPLGFAQTFCRKEFSVLLDPLLLEPGIVDAKLLIPAIKDPARTLEVETHVNAEVNSI